MLWHVGGQCAHALELLVYPWVLLLIIMLVFSEMPLAASWTLLNTLLCRLLLLSCVRYCGATGFSEVLIVRCKGQIVHYKD